MNPEHRTYHPLGRAAILPLLVFLALLATRLPAPAAPDGHALHLDATAPRQTVDGFGASTAWHAANMPRLTPETFDRVNEILWGTGPGSIGLNIHRMRVTTYISHSAEHRFDWEDEKFLRDISTIRKIQDRYDPVLMAVPWTPPAWMKDNAARKGGGRLLPEHYRDYAEWLAEYILTLRERFGIEIDIFSVQNEPGKKRWESCEWTTAELATFIREHLKPAFDERDIDLPIMINEETNWHSRMIDPLLDDPVIGDWVDYAAAHLYWGSHQNPRPFEKAEAMGKRVWMTEFMLENHLYPKGGRPDPLERAVHHAMVMRDTFVDARVNAYLFWWAITTLNKTEQSLLRADFDSDSDPIESFEIHPYVHTLAQYARFVAPGDRVLLVEDAAPTDGFAAVAFSAPKGGRLAVVLINRTDQPVERQLHLKGAPTASLTPHLTDHNHEVARLPDLTAASDGSFTVTVPPVSVLTLVAETNPN